MTTSMEKITQANDLLWVWTDRIIRTRYQQTLLGALWIIVQPVVTVAIFSVIFTFFVPVDTGEIPYPVFSYVAMVPWLLLSGSLTNMTSSLVNNLSLVTKIYFPREILPLADMFARVVDFLVGGAMLVLLMLIFDVHTFSAYWFFLPLILMIQLALIAGLGLIFSAANVFYRDISSLVTIGIQLWFYASPIIYPVSTVPEQLQPYYYLNPMAGILESYRAVLLYEAAPPSSLYISAVVAAVALIVGVWFFRRVEFQFADIL